MRLCLYLHLAAQLLALWFIDLAVATCCSRCGLSIWLLLLAIFNTLFCVYANYFFCEKTDKTPKYSKYSRMTWKWQPAVTTVGVQSINTEKDSLNRSVNNKEYEYFYIVLSPYFWVWYLLFWLYFFLNCFMDKFVTYFLWIVHVCVYRRTSLLDAV